MNRRSLSSSLLALFGSLLISCQDRTEKSSGEGTKAAAPALNAQLQSLRNQARERKWSFTPTLTAVSSRSLQSLTGEVQPTAQQLAMIPQINAQAARVLRSYTLALPRDLRVRPVACNASLARFDWRAHGKVTPPKLQECGDCWAFASAGQIESAMLMAGWTQEDMSEQHILDCSSSGDCGGGRRWDALPWAVGTAVARESQYGYEHGVKKACKANIAGPAKLLAAGWIDGSGAVTPTATLKGALCEYGPISVSINATAALQNYGNDQNQVFDEGANNDGTNHAVLLVGWDDSKQAWLMKNSWGPGWGWGGGYAWVRYGTNNIGRWSFWAKAPAPRFRFTPALRLEVERYRNLAARLSALAPQPAPRR